MLRLGLLAYAKHHVCIFTQRRFSQHNTIKYALRQHREKAGMIMARLSCLTMRLVALL